MSSHWSGSATSRAAAPPGRSLLRWFEKLMTQTPSSEGCAGMKETSNSLEWLHILSGLKTPWDPPNWAGECWIFHITDFISVSQWMDGRLATCCTTYKCISVVLSYFLKVLHPSLYAFYDFIPASAQSASHSLASQFPANSWYCKVVHCFFILAPFRGLQWIVCLYPTLSQHPSLSHQPSAHPTLLHTWTFFVLFLFSPPWHLLSVSNLTACWLCTPRLLTYNLQIWLWYNFK